MNNSFLRKDQTTLKMKPAEADHSYQLGRKEINVVHALIEEDK